MSLTLYIDESGNTGADLHELAQPIFVHAGVWLDEAQTKALEADIAALHREHRVQQPLEKLKGHKLVGSGRGQKFVRDVIRALLNCRTSLAAAILDKPFMAAGVLLEDCCDYVYNDAFDVSWITSPAKEPLALKIYRTVAATILSAAWESRRLGSQAMKTAFDRVFGVMKLSGDNELISLAARMARVDYDELSAAILGARDRTGSDYSPNLTTFGVLIPTCDLQADAFLASALPVRVVHDEQVEFADLFSRSFDIWKHASPYESVVHSTPYRLPLKNLSALDFARSEDHLGIRLADILASALRVSVQEHLSGTPTTRDYFGALRDLCSSREQWGQFPFVIGGQDTQTRVWQHLAPMDRWT